MARTKNKPQNRNRKISETFLQFAEPMLRALGPNRTQAAMEQPLRIAWAIWNAVVYADVAKDPSMLEMLRASIEPDPESKALVAALIERKRTRFADDRWLIGDYELFHKDGAMRLRAEARAPRTRS